MTKSIPCQVWDDSIQFPVQEVRISRITDGSRTIPSRGGVRVVYGFQSKQHQAGFEQAHRDALQGSR